MRRKQNGSFAKIVNHLNSKEIGFTFTVLQIKQELPIVVPSTVYFYLEKLWIIGFVKKIKTRPVSYTILEKIPDKLNTVILCKLSNEMVYRPSWKDWFIHLEDRINQLYKKQYGEE